ncbi:hypothetical protein HU200_023105 [Digitaria exilis]|uniref:Uncharacterized protein n=1 Tax=Digitaria exilis TaxID=1010633 RepID=A0A835EUP7_9POAL|nr:hypothetical protein HU200_023105 [Digitaria exilis]
MGTLPRPAEQGRVRFRSRERRAGAARRGANAKRAELAGEGPPGSRSSELVARTQADKLARSRASSAAPPRRMPPLLFLLLLLAAACCCGIAGDGGGGSCELSVARGGELYSFALAAPTPAHRHGILSEDGFYKVTVNDSILWFQDCGGPLRCGTQCSALVSNTIRELSLMYGTNMIVVLLGNEDESNPQKGLIVKMFSSKCSISVSIFCDPTVAQATAFKHPSGCARSVSASGSGWG